MIVDSKPQENAAFTCECSVEEIDLIALRTKESLARLVQARA